MITTTLQCYHCGSDDLVRNGKTRNGKQRFHCKSCNRSNRENPQPEGYTEEQREVILKAYQERSSMRGISRTFGISRQTLSSWLKKK